MCVLKDTTHCPPVPTAPNFIVVKQQSTKTSHLSPESDDPGNESRVRRRQSNGQESPDTRVDLRVDPSRTRVWRSPRTVYSKGTPTSWVSKNTVSDSPSLTGDECRSLEIWVRLHREAILLWVGPNRGKTNWILVDLYLEVIQTDCESGNGVGYVPARQKGPSIQGGRDSCP